MAVAEQRTHTAQMIYGVLLARLSMDLARLRGREIIALVLESTRHLELTGKVGGKLIEQVRLEASLADQTWAYDGPSDLTVTRVGPLGLSATMVLTAMRDAPGPLRDLLVWRLVCGLYPGAIAAYLGASDVELTAQLSEATAALCRRLSLQGVPDERYLAYGEGEGGVVAQLEQTLTALSLDEASAAEITPALVPALRDAPEVTPREADVDVVAALIARDKPVDLTAFDDAAPTVALAPALKDEPPDFTPKFASVLQDDPRVDQTVKLARALKDEPTAAANPELLTTAPAFVGPFHAARLTELPTVVGPIHPARLSELPTVVGAVEPATLIDPFKLRPLLRPPESLAFNLRPALPKGLREVPPPQPPPLPAWAPPLPVAGPFAGARPLEPLPPAVADRMKLDPLQDDKTLGPGKVPLPVALRPVDREPMPRSDGKWRLPPRPLEEEDPTDVPKRKPLPGTRALVAFVYLALIASVTGSAVVYGPTALLKKDVKMVEVLELREALPPGTQLFPEMFETVLVASGAAGPSAVKPEDLPIVSAHRLRVQLRPNEPLTWHHLDLPRSRRRLASEVKDDLRAYSLEVTAEAGVGLNVQQTDRVDLIVSFRENTDGLKRPVAFMAAEDVLVLAVGSPATRRDKVTGLAADYYSVSLLVLPEDSQRLALIYLKGAYTFTLRNPEDHEVSSSFEVVGTDKLDHRLRHK